jgi:3-hydroxyisobutyrate dehydrogenase
MKFTLFGLGEAGSIFANDLIKLGHQVYAFDPAAVATPSGVVRFDNPVDAVADTEVVISATAAADSTLALEQALDHMPNSVLYADFSTASASLKSQLAITAKSKDIDFVDVALLAVVPGKGIRTTALVAGSGAEQFVEIFTQFGMPVESIGSNAGDAATRKLLRSVFMKGMAAVVIEAIKAGEKADQLEWLWGNIFDEITQGDAGLLHRLVSGTGPHALRRLHEMEASEALLSDLGVDPVMTRSTVQSLKNVLQDGLPKIPSVD